MNLTQEKILPASWLQSLGAIYGSTNSRGTYIEFENEEAKNKAAEQFKEKGSEIVDYGFDEEMKIFSILAKN